MTAFDWKLHPQTEQFLSKIVTDFLENNDAAKKISEKMQLETATRFFDWIDHISLPADRIDPDDLREFGFNERKKVAKEKATKVYTHTASILFPVLLSKSEETIVALKPENLDHFLQMNYSYYNWPSDSKEAHIRNLTIDVNGPYRKALVNKQDNYELWAVERRGYDGFKKHRYSGYHEMYLQILQDFVTRKRNYKNDSDGLSALLDMVKLSCDGYPSERVTDAFFRAERMYWQNQNRASQVQKALQDRLGLGWGNHDHHTYRSSRENFPILIELFETMGFELREQFFAGATAGWGAQVLEHPICGITIFADVDITEEERNCDFAHEAMEPKSKPGTVGLWVNIHGESILQAGMHHLAARVDFVDARNKLESYGIGVIRPFSDFEFLKQSFTVSEKRPVDSNRLDETHAAGYLTKERSELFAAEGAISSHLEIIQRTQGFKGFNQDSVSVIIKTTDPRRSTEL
ncbi:MAG: hypothetical protein ACW98U_04805 [Candidatus Thorarchaeota archaeon]|jgi:hypothetical protein